MGNSDSPNRGQHCVADPAHADGLATSTPPARRWRTRRASSPTRCTNPGSTSPGANSWAGMDKSADYENTNSGNGGQRGLPTYRRTRASGTGHTGTTAAPRTTLRPVPGTIRRRSAAAATPTSSSSTTIATAPARCLHPTARRTFGHHASDYNYKVIPTAGLPGTYQATWARFLRNRPDLRRGSNAARRTAPSSRTPSMRTAPSPDTDFSAMLADVASQGGGESYRAGNESRAPGRLEYDRDQDPRGELGVRGRRAAWSASTSVVLT